MTWQNEYQRWLSHEGMPADLKAQLASCDDVQDRFYKNLTFGTGGLRGVLGAGTNRMNIYTVAKATRGLAAYLNSNGQSPSCAIAYDSRNGSETFARLAASILAEAGVKAYIFAELMPTPLLSWAVRFLGCNGGIVVTASHNPAKYNGYKVYGADGCQITLQAAETVQALIETMPDLSPTLPQFEQLLAKGKIHLIGSEVIEAYYREIEHACPQKPQTALKIVYSPLNGAGNKPVRHMLDRLGNIEVVVVPQQENPDGDFPTCPYPNPEEKEALALASALAKQVNADFFLATDPDCDRVGVGVVHNGQVHLISGNDMGVMMFDYLCRIRSLNGTMPKNPVAVKTIVTTEMAVPVARKYGVELRNVLTGFKFIGEQIGLLEAQNESERYIFGFEESYGYLSGDFVRDKDAVNASTIICAMAAYYKQQGKNLLDVRAQLAKEYGYYKAHLLTFAFEGQSGMQQMQNILQTLRQDSTLLRGGKAPSEQIDYLNDETGLPQSNVLRFSYSDECTVIVRPSGTEPKLKLYLTTSAPTDGAAQALLDELIACCNACIDEK